MKNSTHTSYFAIFWASAKHFGVIFFGSILIGSLIGITSAYVINSSYNFIFNKKNIKNLFRILTIL